MCAAVATAFFISCTVATCTATATKPFPTKETYDIADNSPSQLPQRRLDAQELGRELNNNNNNNNNKDNNDDDDEYSTDLTPYSLRLERCQYVKQFDNAIASNTNYYGNYESSTDSVLSLEQFVVFRFCPKDSCSSCDSDYGEYVTTVSEYLSYLTDMNANRMDSLCNACSTYCWDDAVQNFSFNGGTVTCDGCKNKCNSYQNMKTYGYVDAANYIECTAVYETTKESTTNDDGGTEYYYTTQTYYVGPKCVTQSKYHSSSTGNGRRSKKIRLGVFSDSNCWSPLPTMNVEDILGYKVNYHKFRISESGDDECLACQIQDSSSNTNNNNNNQNNGDSKDDEDEEENTMLDFCYNLHGVSAKCEAKHGFQSGLVQMNGYDAQVSNESAACTFVDSLVYDSYNSYGEIETTDEQDLYDQYVTHSQKITLLVLAFSLVGLTLYGNFLHAEIDDGYPTLRLRLLGEAAQQKVTGIFT
jgi:hypothetical protein